MGRDCFTMKLNVFLFIVFIGMCGAKYPWIGILEVTSDYGAKAATGLIMIQKNVSIAVASDIAKLGNNSLIKTAKSYFLHKEVTYECCLLDYKIHPEYNKVMNTIALVYLNCYDNYWSVINLPNETMNFQSNLYTILLKDDVDLRFRQIKNKVQEVDKNSCEDFYQNEEINFQSLWPKHFICVKADTERSCVVDPGMALVSKIRDQWVLVGISILGPGCSLPSRYIKLSPYITWIQRNIHTNTYRRTYRLDTNLYRSNKNPFIPSESIDRQDDFVLEKLDDMTMVLRKNYSNVRETVMGKCSDIDGEPMYREIGRIEAPGHIGTGVYVLSLFDTLYPNMTCVMVTVHCDKRTKTKLWIDKGFHQDDLEHLIKTVPILGRNTTVPPKILFIKDRYSKYNDYETTNIIFKFEFTGKAKIVVEFFGQKIQNKEEEPKFDDEDFLLRSARKCLF